ncbi:MAG: maleylpyruvate isomerase family mycothiol-dependent enzyme [Acidimicrobiales bacterium]|nr:maleylpyruvate isomerase family mycothiol-dependent enzyme [Acidimicrobiales bacterium]
MSVASRTITALRRSQDHVSALVTGLDGHGLRRSSYAADWSIAQVLSHLGSQAEIFGLLLDAGLSGGDAPGPDLFPPIWDAWNERSPEELAADSIAANEGFVRRLEALDATQLDALHLSAFGMELDAAGFLLLRLPEHAIHTWDIAVVLDPSATVAHDAVELLIDRLPAMAGLVGKATERPTTLRVQTTEPERSFALVTDGVRLEPWTERPHDGVLSLSAEELLRLVYGRLDAGHAASLRLDASPMTLDDLRAVFPGV